MHDYFEFRCWILLSPCRFPLHSMTKTRMILLKVWTNLDLVWPWTTQCQPQQRHRPTYPTRTQTWTTSKWTMYRNCNSNCRISKNRYVPAYSDILLNSKLICTFFPHLHICHRPHVRCVLIVWKIWCSSAGMARAKCAVIKSKAVQFVERRWKNVFYYFEYSLYHINTHTHIRIIQTNTHVCTHYWNDQHASSPINENLFVLKIHFAEVIHVCWIIVIII